MAASIIGGMICRRQSLRKYGPYESTIPGFALGPISTFNEGKLVRIPLILVTIRLRTTTKRKKEIVCIATPLGKEPDDLLYIKDGP